MNVSLIIPCYNEAQRLTLDSVRSLLARPDLSLVLVDDGSTDNTLEILEELAAAHAARVKVIANGQNRGKAESVRAGLNAALDGGADIVGFADADFATPPAEILRLIDCLMQSDAKVLMGSRVKLLGREIRRRAVRHYLGRIFATCASLALDLPVYDTQCGAKFFRATDTLAESLSQPFISGWILTSS